MATTSTAPTVRAAVVAALAARGGLSAVSVTRVWPGDVTPQEAIYLGRTRGTGSYPVIRPGRKPREEEYTIEVLVWVQDPTEWGAASETRAFALKAEIENYVADDPNLGLSAIPTLRAEVGDWEQVPGPTDPGGFGTLIRIDLNVGNRLS